MIKTFKEFVHDYNNFYQTNLNVVKINPNEMDEVMYDLYDTDDFEVNYDEKIIELY